MKNFTAACTVIAHPQVFSCALASGQALLDLRTSTYYNVNNVGSFVWEQLKTPVTVAALEGAVTGEFRVDPDRCHKDVLALLNQFVDHDLIEIRHEGQS
jgi:hypothetical protein